jgi:hypothetical protein
METNDHTEYTVAQQLTEIVIREDDVVEAFQYRYLYPDETLDPPKQLIYVYPRTGVTSAYFYHDGREEKIPDIFPPDQIQLHPSFHPPPIYLSPDQFVTEQARTALDNAVQDGTSLQATSSRSASIAQPANSSPPWDPTWDEIIREGTVSAIDLMANYQYPEYTVPVTLRDKFPFEDPNEALQERIEEYEGNVKEYLEKFL